MCCFDICRHCTAREVKAFKEGKQNKPGHEGQNRQDLFGKGQVPNVTGTTVVKQISEEKAGTGHGKLLIHHEIWN